MLESTSDKCASVTSGLSTENLPIHHKVLIDLKFQLELNRLLYFLNENKTCSCG